MRVVAKKRRAAAEGVKVQSSPPSDGSMFGCLGWRIQARRWYGSRGLQLWMNPHTKKARFHQPGGGLLNGIITFTNQHRINLRNPHEKTYHS